MLPLEVAIDIDGKTARRNAALRAACVLSVLLALVPFARAADDPLPSWNDGAAKTALVDKPEGIHLMIGRRPVAAFGNSTGDRQMLAYATAGTGRRLGMLVLHDDARREYAYGPADGLPDSRIGTFPQALYDEARKNGWVVISMKRDWKRIFAFE